MVISTIPCLVEYLFMVGGGDGYVHHSMLGRILLCNRKEFLFPPFHAW